jgi:hypothetical protein
MGPPSYRRNVVYRNVVMRRVTAYYVSETRPSVRPSVQPSLHCSSDIHMSVANTSDTLHCTYTQQLHDTVLTDESEESTRKVTQRCAYIPRTDVSKQT